MMRVRTDWVRLRRLELGCSQLTVAGRSGIAPSQLRSLEAGGPSEFLTLRDVARLAEVLGVNPLGLLETGDPVPPLPTDRDDGTSVRRLGAILATAKAAVAVDALVAATGEAAAVVDQQLADLDRALRPVGQQVVRARGQGVVRLAADADVRLDAAAVRDLTRRTLGRLDLKGQPAKLLHQILTGSVTAKSILARPQGRITLGQLTRAGWVQPPTTYARPLEVTEEVRVSLVLDERPPRQLADGGPIPGAAAPRRARVTRPRRRPA